MSEVAYFGHSPSTKPVEDRIGDAFAEAANRDQIQATSALLTTLRTIAVETSDIEFVHEELERMIDELENI